MNKKLWLIIIIFSILVLGIFYWYLNYQFKKIKPTTSPEKTKIEGIESIPLEKPPFLK